VAVHLGFPQEVFDCGVFILVAFDMVTGERDWETVEDVCDFALEVALSREAVVWIVPRSMHCEVDAIDESLVVAVEKMVNIVRDLDLEIAEAVIEEEHE